MEPSPSKLLDDIHREPNQPGVQENTIDALLARRDLSPHYEATLRSFKQRLATPAGRQNQHTLNLIHAYLDIVLRLLGGRLSPPQPEGGRRLSQTKRFNRCVKAVRRSVKARKGSSKESAAIAICTTSILHPRGRTLKRYRKGRLLTQKRRR